MDREAMEALRYDRRLARRRGWISDEERQQAEQNLPDVSVKATTLGEATGEPEPAAAAGSPPPSGAPPRYEP